MCRNLYLLICLLWLAGCASVPQNTSSAVWPLGFTVTVTNTAKTEALDAPVFIDERELLTLAADFNPRAFVVRYQGQEVPSQYIDVDPFNEGILVMLDELKGRGSTKLEVRYAEEGIIPREYPARAQAELSVKKGGHFEDRKYIGGTFENIHSLRVPPEVTDHSYYMRYEGPGWESDKVGYRLYMDWRRGTDVFGKQTTDMVLQQVGLDGYESYHHLQPWGMDVMKVGSSLGLGSPALFHHGQANRIDSVAQVQCEISENGPLYGSFNTTYTGWQVNGLTLDVESWISIHAGSRLTHQVLLVTSDEQPTNLSTGIVKDEAAKRYTSVGGENAWGYLATYGKQSLNGDHLGLVVFFRPTDLLEFTEDAHSHVVSLKPQDGVLDYYYGAAWELEPNGIKTAAEFLTYIQETARALANPLLAGIDITR